PTCSHDLPNQILSLQSLINLMEMDEAERLDPAGREYLLRLRTVADKMAGMADFLRTMVRLMRHVSKPHEIVLADLFRELQAEARSCSATAIAWDLAAVKGTICADRDLVYPSVSELIRALTDVKVAKSVTVTSSDSDRRKLVAINVRGSGMPKP